MFINGYAFGAISSRQITWGLMHPRKAVSSAIDSIINYTFKQGLSLFALVAPDQYRLIKGYLSLSGAGISTSVITAAMASFVISRGLVGSGLAIGVVSATSAYVTHRTYTSEERKLESRCKTLEKDLEKIEAALKAAIDQGESIKSAAQVTHEQVSNLKHTIDKLTGDCFAASTAHRPVFAEILQALNRLEEMILDNEDQLDVLDQLQVVSTLVTEQLRKIGV